MAIHGHQSRVDAETAFRTGIGVLGDHLDVPDTTPLPTKAPPIEALVRSMHVLDNLPMVAKKQLVDALARSAASDGRIEERELAMLRGVCNALHCPIPPV